MFEAVRVLIERASIPRPVAILIDDVHWADRGIARNEESVLVGEDLLRLLMAIQMCWATSSPRGRALRRESAWPDHQSPAASGYGACTTHGGGHRWRGGIPGEPCDRRT